MAITQISQITNRKGLQIDLPDKLAGAELGWCIDSRRLFIGNGELVEGAPTVGNTEILTEFSDIIKLNASYTYEGESAGYIVQTGPTIDDPVVMSLQTWMDQWVTVKDFGATGDGFTDDTAAINRALFQIYCVDVNPQVRRALYFPAGVYRITAPILVPPYATLYGEGAENSIIQLDRNTGAGFVMITADSDQQTGVVIGSNGAVLPQSVTLSDLCLATLDNQSDILLLDCVNTVRINAVAFRGALNDDTDLSTPDLNSAGIRFRSNQVLVTNSVTVFESSFSQLTYAVTTLEKSSNENSEVKGVTIANSKLFNLYEGIIVGRNVPTTKSPTGFRITSNLFQTIYSRAIYFGAVRLNVSSYNIFYDVGNYFFGDLSPYVPVIEIVESDNLSIGDLFSRPDSASLIADPGTSYPRVELNESRSISFNNSKWIQMGSFIRESGYSAQLLDNESVPITVDVSLGVAFSINTQQSPWFTINYSMVRGSIYRTGAITASSIGTATLTWSDDYVENEFIGVDLSLMQINDLVFITYSTTNIGLNTDFKFSVQTFSYQQ